MPNHDIGNGKLRIENGKVRGKKEQGFHPSGNADFLEKGERQCRDASHASDYIPRKNAGLLNQSSDALTQEVVVAGGGFVVVRELCGPNLFPVLEGIFHRVEGAAFGGALGHHHHLAEGGLQTVSPHECLRGGLHAKGLLADDQSLLA